MSEFKNVSTAGDLEVPVVGRVIKSNGTFTVPDSLDEGFLAQPSLWALVEKKESK